MSVKRRWQRAVVRGRRVAAAAWEAFDVSDVLLLGGTASLAYGAALHWSEPVGLMLGGAIVLGVGLLRDVLPLLLARSRGGIDAPPRGR